MPQTPAPTRANVRQSATWRISDTNLSPPCQLTTHAADSMLFLSKSRLFGFLPTKFPEYPFWLWPGVTAPPVVAVVVVFASLKAGTMGCLGILIMRPPLLLLLGPGRDTSAPIPRRAVATCLGCRSAFPFQVFSASWT